LADGTLLRGEVLSRWQELVSKGELLRSLDSSFGRIRDRLTARERVMPTTPLNQALLAGLAAFVRARAKSAVEQSVLRWREIPAGEGLVAQRRSAGDVSMEFEARLARDLREWQDDLHDLVRAQGEGRRGIARALSLGVEGTVAVLCAATFACDMNLSDQEGATDLGDPVGAAGTAALAHRILGTMYDAQTVAALIGTARADLLERVNALLDIERTRLRSMLELGGVRSVRADALRAAMQGIEEAR
jgi:hypothetical protein